MSKGEQVLKRITILVIAVLLSVFCLGEAAAQSGAENQKTTDIDLYVDGIRVNPETGPLLIDGRLLYPARTAFSKMYACLFWFRDEQRIRMQKDSTIIDMRVGSNEVLVDGVPARMDVPPLLVGETVMVPVRFVAETFSRRVTWDGDNRQVYVGKKPVIAQQVFQRETKQQISRNDGRKYKVVIDPGHGGRDPGARAYGVCEKDLNLDISLRLEKILKEKGISTYMTRRSDTYPSLYYRAYLANRINADLFLSIHNNAGYSKYHGSMALYCPGRTRKFNGKDFAAIVQNELVTALGSRNTGTRPRNELVVLRETHMPAVIAEIGFMTNRAEFLKLNTESYRQKAAQALADAVLKALRHVH